MAAAASLLVPRRVCQLIAKAKPAEVEVRASEQRASFALHCPGGGGVPAVGITTRLIEGVFPSYRHVVSGGYAGSVTLDLAETRAALRRATAVLGASGSVQLRLNGSVELYASEYGSGEFRATLDRAVADCTPMVMAFNPGFLEAGLAVCADGGGPGSRVLMELSSPTRPAVLHPVGDGHDDTYVLMPVTLNP